MRFLSLPSNYLFILHHFQDTITIWPKIAIFYAPGLPIFNTRGTRIRFLTEITPGKTRLMG